MLIANVFNPQLLQGSSAEETIFSSGIGSFYDEIRRVIFDTKVTISPRTTSKKGQDSTGAPGLAASLNVAMGNALISLGWDHLKAPGGTADISTVDWFKAKKSNVAYAPTALGIGLEIQFGNNYQFNEDIKRLSEAYIAGIIQAGIAIVPSNALAKHKADRGAYFSDAKSKLERHYQTLYGAQARKIPPIMIIAIQHDGYNDDPSGLFTITPVTYSPVEGSEIFIPTSQPEMTNKIKPVLKPTNKKVRS